MRPIEQLRRLLESKAIYQETVALLRQHLNESELPDPSHVKPSEWPVEQTRDNYFRRVSHDLRLATTGFMGREGIERNTDIIRVNPTTIQTMRRRYDELFGNSQ